MKLKDKISWIMGRLQRSLFPALEECCASPLTEQEERKTIARCYVAKAVFRYPHTRILINELRARSNLRLICGFAKRKDVPSESTFSRAFAAFAGTDLGKTVHNAMVTEYLSGELIGHVSRDSTAIVGREKAAKKTPKIKVSRKKGRPAKEEKRQPLEPKRLDRQSQLTAEEAVAELSTICDRGVKKNAKGYTETWNGFKLHVDVNDTGLPLSVVLTSASVHDSQVAIPLMKLTSGKVQYCYDLMDAAYPYNAI